MGSPAPARVLFVSGSIGLGHAARDLAIVSELRRLRPAVEVEWLAGDPARCLIEEAEETLLPESSELPDETGAAERASRGFSLNIVSYLLRARGAWKQTVATFEKVVERHRYDLVVGDETYGIAVALHKRPELKRWPFTIIYDFVGMEPMTRNPAERAMVYVWNRIWCGGHQGRRPAADQVLFVGEPEDVVDRPFGYRLPNRRAYALRYYEFVGYVLGFDPAAYRDRARIRSVLGYEDGPVILCSVGGTSVGADLLDRCAAAFPEIERRVPGVRMVLACGPRLDPASLRAPSRVQVLGYAPGLHEHLAACDLAIVQGGGTTTLELTALRRPFIYIPLDGHYEQEVAVADRARAAPTTRSSATRGLLRDTEALRQLARRTAGAQQLDRLATELRRIGGAGSRHDRHHPFAAGRRKPSGVRETGSTPKRLVAALSRCPRQESNLEPSD